MLALMSRPFMAPTAIRKMTAINGTVEKSIGIASLRDLDASSLASDEFLGGIMRILIRNPSMGRVKVGGRFHRNVKGKTTMTSCGKRDRRSIDEVTMFRTH